MQVAQCILHAAEKEGYTLPAAGQAYVDASIEQTAQSVRASGYSSLEHYLRTNFGSYMTEKLYKEILTAQTIATYYQQDHQDNLTYSDEELEAYYQENKNNLDTFNYSVFTVQASIETTTTDEEGNSVDLTDEEKQAWIAQMSGVTVGSDAFFPFGDNVERARKSGVQYIAQPGGSIRDQQVIDTADKYGMVMAFTGIRLFHH